MPYTKIRSYAKINLALNITGKTSNLHNIESIIAFIDLHDDIFIKVIKSRNHSIKFVGKFSKNIGNKNTISNLLKLLDKKNLLRHRKFSIKINKRVPNKAGLGGGSMNAANVLKYFIKKKIVKIPKKTIFEISKSIGSDVILGLNQTYCILTSKNKITNFPRCTKIHTLIIKPNFGCLTKDIYSKVRKLSKPKFNKPNKKMFDYNYLKKSKNALEPIVFSKYKILEKIKMDLENLQKCLFARMSGSGSALIAYFSSKKTCQTAYKQIRKKYKNYWCMASKTI